MLRARKPVVEKDVTDYMALNTDEAVSYVVKLEQFACLGNKARTVAGRQGFEPRYADPESAVLPLDDLPTVLHILTCELFHRPNPNAA